MKALNVVCVGPPRSGKTHFYTLLAYHLNDRFEEGLRSIEIKGYVRDIDGNMVSFHKLLNRLYFGQKIPSTAAPTLEEGPFKLFISYEVPGLLRARRINLPLVDLSGEVIVEMMKAVVDVRRGLMQPEDFPRRMEELGISAKSIHDILNFVADGDVYLHVINLELLYLAETNPDELERLGLPRGTTISDIIAGYGDFIEALKFFRRFRGISKPMRHAIVFTFYDKVKEKLVYLTSGCTAEDYGCIGEKLFEYYARTLRAAGIRVDRNSIFVSYTEEDPKDPENKFLLMHEDGKRVLSYPRKEYDRLLNFLARL